MCCQNGLAGIRSAGSKGLGELSRRVYTSRAYIKNGGKLKGEYFRAEDKNGKARREPYREYAERMVEEAVEGCFDWSIFENRT